MVPSYVFFRKGISITIIQVSVFGVEGRAEENEGDLMDLRS
ncbi:hypothetical protein JOC76_001943 [Neobacillus cucumis]|nr:hypothetical protein [Neobacillus cucumis]